MSKKSFIRRYSIIINQLRKVPSTFVEISEKLKKESEIEGYDYVISKRTLKRDIEDILFLYGIEIVFDFSKRVYAIQDAEFNTMNLKVLEAFDIINAFNLSSGNDQYLHFDNRQAQGTQHLLPIFDAIKNRKLIQIKHQKFADEISTSRQLEPLALKESNYRWYLVARESGDEQIKTFGLDRILFVETSRKKFTYPETFNVHEFFKYSFGIVSGKKNTKPQTIELSFLPTLKQYLLTLPMHHSQQVLIDDEQEFKIMLNLFVTPDLVREIASYGHQVLVIRPLSLRETIQNYANPRAELT